MRHAPPLCLAGASLLVPSVILLETGLGHHIRQVLLREIPQKTRHSCATLLDRFLLELVVVVYAHSVAATFAFLCAASEAAGRRRPPLVALVNVLLSKALNLRELGNHELQRLMHRLCAQLSRLNLSAQLPRFLGSLSEAPHAVVRVFAPFVLLHSPVLEYIFQEESFVVDSVLLTRITNLNPDQHPLVLNVEAENAKRFPFTLPS
mmetsp:Transcript_7248/g.15968  ORF Transcript_7248/g.15968 Transcript_7248/m.15968 type:complete len:206 (-) Transcript_7248:53-670(-)